MYQRGIRGAITIDNNTADCIEDGVTELIQEIIKMNGIKPEDVSNIIFTMTKDLNCIYPAQILREKFIDWKYVPMICVSELEIENSLKKCLRVLINVNTEKKQEDIKHVYLKGAEVLRKDLK